jgi:hypothetical protein
MRPLGSSYDALEEAVNKLYLLRDSCDAIYLAKSTADRALPSEIWFSGARMVCEEVLDITQNAMEAIAEHLRQQEKAPTD